jgi:hypothetical protein
MKTLNLIRIAALISLAPAGVALAESPECQDLQKQIDAVFADPRADQCDGSRDGECAAFWDQLDAIYDKFDAAGCTPADSEEDEGQ